MLKSAELMHLDFYVGGGGRGHTKDMVYRQIWKDDAYALLHF